MCSWKLGQHGPFKDSRAIAAGSITDAQDERQITSGRRTWHRVIYWGSFEKTYVEALRGSEALIALGPVAQKGVVLAGARGRVGRSRSRRRRRAAGSGAITRRRLHGGVLTIGHVCFDRCLGC